MSVQSEHLALLLFGLLAGCDKDAAKISAEPVSSAREPAEVSTTTKTKPAASVEAREVTPAASGSAKPGKCAAGGCGPGKCA